MVMLLKCLGCRLTVVTVTARWDGTQVTPSCVRGAVYGQDEGTLERQWAWSLLPRGSEKASQGQWHWVRVEMNGSFQDRQTEERTVGAEGGAWEGTRDEVGERHAGLFRGTDRSLDFML